VEWAVSGILGAQVRLNWSAQFAAPGMLRTELCWRARPGTAGRIAAALRGWSPLRLEVTEEPSDGNDGERYALTPDLGLFRATMSANGDVLIQEDRLRTLLASCRELESLRQGMHRLLGTAWDDELERYRQAADGGPVRRLTQVV
jgi:hypothetical protein